MGTVDCSGRLIRPRTNERTLLGAWCDWRNSLDEGESDSDVGQSATGQRSEERCCTARITDCLEICGQIDARR